MRKRRFTIKPTNKKIQNLHQGQCSGTRKYWQLNCAWIEWMDTSLCLLHIWHTIHCFSLAVNSNYVIHSITHILLHCHTYSFTIHLPVFSSLLVLHSILKYAACWKRANSKVSIYSSKKYHIKFQFEPIILFVFVLCYLFKIRGMAALSYYLIG